MSSEISLSSLCQVESILNHLKRLCPTIHPFPPLSPLSSYPYAVVGIHMIEMIHGWLRDLRLNSYLYTTCNDWPLTTGELMEMFCKLGVYLTSHKGAENTPQNLCPFSLSVIVLLSKAKPFFNRPVLWFKKFASCFHHQLQNVCL